MSSPPPLWRRAYDAVDRSITPHAESFVRTPTFAQGAALFQRVQSMARDGLRDLSSRAWHLVNLPAGSDVSRLRAQVGSLDREVRRLTLQLEIERRRTASRGTATIPEPAESPAIPSTTRAKEEQHADGPEPAGGSRSRAPRRRAQRPPGA